MPFAKPSEDDFKKLSPKERAVYFMWENTDNALLAIDKHHQDQSDKLVAEFRSYILHISILSGATIGAVASFGRELIVQNPGLTHAALLALASSFIGGLGFVLWRVESSAKGLQNSYNAARDVLAKVKQVYEKFLDLENPTQEDFIRVVNATEQEQNLNKPKVKTYHVVTDKFIWLIFSLFALGVVLLAFAFAFSGNERDVQKHHFHNFHYNF